ncbi:hypothetical protein [Fructilactobacillus florum]|uniref:Uncharacterized protein n=1 Tax=Fructilactobacillus florum DSM 22689 = JCM 16035 TaxID=1423745 RepID=A0A0R2CPC6_9LACO|nr:hypothetical protein [Fructilactobacillus florum]KRM91716.1 hypothetical protein FC87_GL000540 [Fructilactobacillus florum DSM 22689 = JCM 16035]
MSLDSRQKAKKIDQLETKLDNLKREYHEKQDEIFNVYRQGNRYLNQQHDVCYNVLIALDIHEEIKIKTGYLFEEFGDGLMRHRKKAETQLYDEFQVKQKDLNKQLDEIESKTNDKRKEN